MAAARCRPRAGGLLRTALALGLAATLGACGSAVRSATPAGAARIDAATHALLRSPGFHVVYVDGDRGRTLVADVSAAGDVGGSLLVGAEAFPYRVVGTRVYLRAPATGPWTAVTGDAAAVYRALPSDIAGLAACVDGTPGTLVDGGIATVDGQSARRLHLRGGDVSLEVDVSTSTPAHLVRFVQHRAGHDRPPPGCPGADIEADVSAVGVAPTIVAPAR